MVSPCSTASSSPAKSRAAWVAVMVLTRYVLSDEIRAYVAGCRLRTVVRPLRGRRSTVVVLEGEPLQVGEDAGERPGRGGDHVWVRDRQVHREGAVSRRGAGQRPHDPGAVHGQHQ